ncbi:MAG: hypothetical protein RIE52_00285 [Balneola sp.]|jgi:mannose/fructose/N-acetylgalactosamine-specific phosphotransferase system component IIC
MHNIRYLSISIGVLVTIVLIVLRFLFEKFQHELDRQSITIDLAPISDIMWGVLFIVLLLGIAAAIYSIRKKLNTTQNKYGLGICSINLIYIILIG